MPLSARLRHLVAIRVKPFSDHLAVIRGGGGYTPACNDRQEDRSQASGQETGKEGSHHRQVGCEQAGGQICGEKARGQVLDQIREQAGGQICGQKARRQVLDQNCQQACG